MSPRRSAPPSAAAVSSGDGCLSGFLIPPLAVLVVSLLMFCLLGSSGALTTEAETEGAATATVVESVPAAQIDRTGGLSPVFTPEVQYWADDLLRWATEAGLDPNLAAAVMQIESCGDPRARSRAGAMGLFQVMPYHFAAGENPYDPDTNARRGLDYLRRSLAKAGGDLRLTFAGYNGGIGVIGRSEAAWANETVRYAYWGSGIYAEAVSGAAESLRLQEWLAAGGASLCRQAAEQLGIEP